MGITNPLLDSNENKWGTLPDDESKSKVTWVAFVLLAAVLGATAYYGYFAWHPQNIKISELFGSQSAQTALNEQKALSQRVRAAENNLRELAGGSDGLGQRVKTLENLENKAQGNLQQSRKYAEALTQQLRQQLSAELETRTSVLDSRLRQVEDEQTAQRSELAAVQDELKENSASIASVRDETGQDISGVHQQVETNARDLGVLTQRLDPKRVDFEMNKGQTHELVPGIVLRISATNTQHQRYRGSLWLAQDRRTLWLRDQSIHEPVRFFHREAGDAYELVVTDVGKKFVSGYLLVPVQQEAADTSADRETATNTSADDANAR